MLLTKRFKWYDLDFLLIMNMLWVGQQSYWNQEQAKLMEDAHLYSWLLCVSIPVWAWEHSIHSLNGVQIHHLVLSLFLTFTVPYLNVNCIFASATLFCLVVSQNYIFTVSDIVQWLIVSWLCNNRILVYTHGRVWQIFHKHTYIHSQSLLRSMCAVMTQSQLWKWKLHGFHCGFSSQSVISLCEACINNGP